MRIQTIVYVTDMDACVAWYRAVLGVDAVHHGSQWSSFRVGTANLALHHIDKPPQGGRVELSLVTTEPLDEVSKRLESAGLSIARGIADEAFGRSVQVRDPEGMLVQINEHDPDLYDD